MIWRSHAIMKKLLCLIAAVLASGCSSDWSAGLVDKRTGTAATRSSAIPADAVPGSQPAPLGLRPSRLVAGAPDRGSLVQYPAHPVVRRSGAYTWHAAELSEDHALRSTITGNLSFTAPDGTRIDLAYERHVEHPDGNWSWIGRTQGERGENTVITFGDQAVFGTIPQAGAQPPLRLTMADGRTWVVASDPRRLREIRNEATHPTRPDFLVPPKLIAAQASAGSTVQMESAGAQAVSASASGDTVIDVVVGFTDGFAAYRGGASAAITRAHNLVDVTNEAYVSSQVNTRVRLVHAMSVSYPDATANQRALEELTGFEAPSTQTTPSPAFSALRSARNEYGADLVVLLRRFQTPENDGCGIAWLIGGGRSGIDASDQFFGYSVVSDGQDAGTDGKNYYCREETFAHELGHNMGSQHDSANAMKNDGSQSYGVYSYSFGLKTTTGAGNFYTVMAYGDSGQTSNRVFSNPRVSICGSDRNLACGVVGESDNARSLNQTSPIIATFRATVVPTVVQRKVEDDFNGDGVSDILWRNSNTGANTIWRSANSATGQAVSTVASQAWQVVGTGDFDGDGPSDVLWRNSSTGTNTIWRSGNSATGQAVSTVASQAWQVAGVGDFDGDDQSDVLWRNSSTGANTIWRSGNSATGQTVSSVASSAWRIVGVGDFDGDNRSDILWRNFSTGANTIWRSGNSATGQAVSSVAASSAWRVVAVGDFDGDGRADILWRNFSTGANTIWRSGNSATGQAVSTVASQAWQVAGVGDFDGDGQSDVLWRNSSTGANTIWRSGNSATSQAVSSVAPSSAWVVVDK